MTSGWLLVPDESEPKPPAPAPKHTIESMSFLEKPLLRVRSFALVIFYEMVDLAKHRTGSSHLPHQPFEHAVARFALLRQQLSGLVGQKLRLELLVLADVDRVDGVGQTKFLQHDGSLAAIGSCPGIQIDHGLPFQCG